MSNSMVVCRYLQSSLTVAMKCRVMYSNSRQPSLPAGTAEDKKPGSKNTSQGLRVRILEAVVWSCVNTLESSITSGQRCLLTIRAKRWKRTSNRETRACDRMQNISHRTEIKSIYHYIKLLFFIYLSIYLFTYFITSITSLKACEYCPCLYQSNAQYLFKWQKLHIIKRTNLGTALLKLLPFSQISIIDLLIRHSTALRSVWTWNIVHHQKLCKSFRSWWRRHGNNCATNIRGNTEKKSRRGDKNFFFMQINR